MFKVGQLVEVDFSPGPKYNGLLVEWNERTAIGKVLCLGHTEPVTVGGFEIRLLQ